MKYRNQYNTVIDNTTRMLTNPSPLATYTNKACGHVHISHSRPESNKYGGNSHSTNHTYQRWKNRRHTYDIAPFHYYIQTMISEPFTIEGQPSQVMLCKAVLVYLHYIT